MKTSKTKGVRTIYHDENELSTAMLKLRANKSNKTIRDVCQSTAKKSYKMTSSKNSKISVEVGTDIKRNSIGKSTNKRKSMRNKKVPQSIISQGVVETHSPRLYKILTSPYSKTNKKNNLKSKIKKEIQAKRKIDFSAKEDNVKRRKKT